MFENLFEEAVYSQDCIKFMWGTFVKNESQLLEMLKVLTELCLHILPKMFWQTWLFFTVASVNNELQEWFAKMIVQIVEIIFVFPKIMLREVCFRF